MAALPENTSNARPPSAVVWIVAAAAAALAIAGATLAVYGDGRAGIEAALRLTARLGFLLFWPSYVGGALAMLFGAAFEPLKRAARQLGLGFSAVVGVHLGLVTWLCLAGGAPSLRVFAIFGFAAFWVALLAGCSIERVGRAIGRQGWWILRNIGMNYIAFAFALDFIKTQRPTSALNAVEYLPFAALSVAGPALRLAAWLKRLVARQTPRPTLPLAAVGELPASPPPSTR